MANEFNTQVFHGIAAIFGAAPWLLPLARGVAVGTAWLVAALVAWSLWRWPAQRRYLLVTMLACGITTLLAHYIAAKLAVPRPFVSGFGPSYISHSPTGSLPSSHAAVLMLIALMYLRRRPLRRLGAVLLLLACATGLARVFVGVHFPLDIAAGFGLGAAVAGLLHLAETAFTNGKRIPPEGTVPLRASAES
ncbi:phosphatase PAP2 family protein [Rhodoferax koreense]|nr:phosphatase PAP2 family protein [Rhodoferax koreense]